jgi:hypothetical protein
VDLNYDHIRDGLRRLRESRQTLKVFGAETHRFQVHPPLAEAAVRQFEDRHGIQLPPDYRGFLIHIGNGGAGPAYGLFKLGEMDDSLGQEQWQQGDGFVGVLSKPFPHRAAWNDRTGEPAYDDTREDDPEWEDEYQEQMDAWEKLYWNPANVNGAIPICHLGCAIRQWLIVSGPESGNVWHDDRVDLGGLKPVHQKGRDRVTFGQWYTDWLDDALQQLRAR